VTSPSVVDDDLSIQTIHVASAPDRPEVGLAIAAAAALLAPALSLAVGISPAWLPGLGSVWRAAHLSAATGLDTGPFMGVLATQAIVLIAVTLVWRAVAVFAPQAGWVLPEWRADSQARELLDLRRPGVLLYVADAQRCVRVLADPRVAARLAPGAMEAARNALAEGMASGDGISAFASARVALRTPAR